MTRRPTLRCCQPIRVTRPRGLVWVHSNYCTEHRHERLTEAELAELRHPSGEGLDESKGEGYRSTTLRSDRTGGGAGETAGVPSLRHDPIGCDEPECQDLVRRAMVTAWPELRAVGLSPKDEKEIET